ncbi:MAG: phage terminase large subunit family protein [Reyranella sp.]|uniref:phage terminase large subunit family protein n=1 Tax=Reyranella sp. TaxID=1929291 RepID=UPI0025D3DF73|nr:terminase gpA endonuclease subunit [Reyranella sp.]MBR2813463.1 phage terminase large subunit family protein [Reyranella sp.]
MSSATTMPATTTEALALLTPLELRKQLPALGSARRTVRRAWRRGLRSDPGILPSTWAEKHRVIGEGTSAHPGKWRNARTPFAVEPMDCMAPGHWARRCTIVKSVQIVGSEIVNNVLGWTIDATPGPAMLVHPTVEAVRDWTVEKFEPAIESTSRLKRKVADVVVRGRKGSTLKRKIFPGGSVIFAGANSGAGLRQHSVRLLILDDLDEFPLKIAGQGDVIDLARGRLTSFEKSGQDKELAISTPTLLSTSRIWKQYLAGTQGKWHVPCPHCGHEQVLEWGGKDVAWGLKFNTEAPYRAHYICRSGNGCVIENWQLEGMNARGRWIHAMPFPGRQPSYHLNSLISPFTTWDSMVSKWIDAQGDPEKLQTFVNLQLGLPWDESGDRPKAAELLERRETWPVGTVPLGVLLMTLSADVQGNGIWYRFMGHGRDRQTWGLEHGFLDGETGTETGAAFKKLDELRKKKFRDVYGNDRTVDIMGVDANFETEVVVNWCSKRPNCFPLRGEDGWKQPAWTNKPTARQYSERGKARRKGARTYPVGTWPLKRRHFGALKVKKQPDEILYPASYCHFNQDWTEADFTQLLAEVFTTQRHRKTGKVTQGWHQVETDNHLLDCTVYGLALAEKLGMSTKSPAEWEWLERKWQRLASEQRSLFDTPELPDEPPLGSSAPPAMPPPNAVRSVMPPMLEIEETIILG